MIRKDLVDIMFPNVEHDIKYYENKYKRRDLNTKAIVTRFAPSPTGFVHMGSLLTAFIANKAAKDTSGVFYLRIEDTDKKRSVENGVKNIISDLNNFDITIDEGVISENEQIGEYGPYIQSERKEIYDCYCKYLVENDMAYPCFCSEEELNNLREHQEYKKERIGYYGKYAKCRNLTIDEAYEKIKSGESYVIRLKSNGNFEKEVIVNDVVRGKIAFPENDIDTVLIKSNGIPVYHFAHVIDDHLMHTTHVLRGEEWLSSLPIHLQLFKMFNFELPKFAHLGLLMKIDENGSRRKLSKRKDQEAAVSYYQEKGIPIEAVKLYLMTIANSNFEGWLDSNPGKSIDEFKFDFKKVSISGSLFDLNKLLNISKNYISRLPATQVYNDALSWARIYDTDLYELLINHKEESIASFNIERNQKKPRKDMASYSEVKDSIWYMFDEIFYNNDDIYSSIEIKDYFDKEVLIDYINNYYDVNDTKEQWYNRIKDLAKKYNFAIEVKLYKENSSEYKGHVGDICELIRVAVTTQTMTPDLYEILKILGKEKINDRIEKFNNILL